MIYFLVLAGMAKKVFKTAAFNRSAIPPFTILPDSIKLGSVTLVSCKMSLKRALDSHTR
jgi:hypothetical protein